MSKIIGQRATLGTQMNVTAENPDLRPVWLVSCTSDRYQCHQTCLRLRDNDWKKEQLGIVHILRFFPLFLMML